MTGIHRLPPHSRNVANMADEYSKYNQQEQQQQQHKAVMQPPPCVCLDSSSLASAQNKDISSSIGWQFRLFQNPNCIPLDYILPTTSSTTATSDQQQEESTPLVFCTNKVSIPHNWTMMPCHRKKSNNNPNIIQECGCQLSDPPRYTNVRMPFDTLYPHVPKENPTGVYRLEFEMEDAYSCCWRKRDGNYDNRIILHFGAVESCFFVFMNGKFVGMGKDSRLPSEFDVTSLLKCGCIDCSHCKPSHDAADSSGKNVLAVVALKWSDGSFLEQQDHWRGMGGIHRSVYLYALPKDGYIEDVFCRATVTEKLNSEKKNSNSLTKSLFKWKGKIQVDARIGRDHNTRVEGRDIYYNEEIGCERSSGSRTEYRMMFQLYDFKGVAVFDKPLDVMDRDNGCFAEVHQRFNLISFVADMPGKVMPWSDEDPTLYRLEATLFIIETEDGSLRPIDKFCTRVGFRSIEITNRQLLINGQPVLIKGVNRHDHSPTNGKAITREEIYKDLTLMKEYNFNAIRTAHYPNDPYLYDLADELGLYVIDEANIECHGHYDMICREHSFTAAMLDRVQRMVVRDQNHPSIIGFSIGNEAGFSMNHTMLYGWIKGYDDSRFVQYEGANRPKWGQLPHVYDRKDSMLGTDVICPMYASINEMVEWADVIAPRLNEHRPMILCEYAHAMGNSSGSLSDYWEAIKSTNGLQGGFIWDWIDQGLLEKDTNGCSWFAYGGDYGDSPHDANFNINGMISPARKPHPAMLEHKKLGQYIDFALELREGGIIIRIFNRKYFTYLSKLEAHWSLKVDGFVRDEGSFPVPGVPPQCSFAIPIQDLSQSFERHKLKYEGAEVHLGVKAISLKHGTEVAVEQFAVSDGGSIQQNLNKFNTVFKIVEGCQSKAETNQSESLSSIEANGHHLKVPHDTLQMKYVSNAGDVVMDGLRVNLFRAGTDNDGVKQFAEQFHDKSKPLGTWLSLGLDSLDFESANTCLETVKVPISDHEEKTYPGIVTRATIVGRPGRNVYEEISLARNISSKRPVVLGSLEQSMTLLCDGSLFLNIKVDLKDSLKDLPRIGVELLLPKKFEETWYFANGPHENYPDRRFSAHAGVYKMTVSDSLNTDYVVPQEQGNRTGLRWL